MYWTEILQAAENCGAILTRKGLTIATAESCTGGGIAYALTEIAGSSAYFTQSWVTYSNLAKENCLGVAADTLEKYGAVSEQVVAEMATGVLQNSGADIAVTTSGIAGPGGATETKPVGLVHFAWQIKGQYTLCEHKVFAGDRAAVRQQAILYALSKIVVLLEKNFQQKT
ncbi:CinA-like protein [Catenovulum agarivorans DS-2]|uniref:CinA-like protein n=1 Tax=Catenovulum agarivorans DS-2 TaxID=1328313 RepID=W7QMJ0_9ALTE|nr:CinA family protein [Catenovulum agarivorans]EWH10152.1 CinA-like protein [Catenovulum agarivorans DS-2]